MFFFSSAFRTNWKENEKVLLNIWSGCFMTLRASCFRLSAWLMKRLGSISQQFEWFSTVDVDWQTAFVQYTHTLSHEAITSYFDRIECTRKKNVAHNLRRETKLNATKEREKEKKSRTTTTTKLKIGKPIYLRRDSKSFQRFHSFSFFNALTRLQSSVCVRVLFFSCSFLTSLNQFGFEKLWFFH